MLCVGQVYRASVKVGDGTAPAGSVTLTIKLPDQSMVAGIVPVQDLTQGQGYYYFDYTLAQAGLHKFAWTTQNPGTAPPPDFVSVRDFISIISFAEARAHLNKTSNATDDELSAFMMAATELVESKVGICVPRTFTERIDQGRLQLVSVYKPILSVTSVTSIWPGGPSWPGSLIRWDAEAGIIYQIPPFDFWWGPWDVVLTSGRQVIAERHIHAAKEQLRHLWETQRGGQPPALLEGEQEFTTSAGFTFSVPRRVLELLEEDMVPSS
jgi:hypothetical protein